MGLVRNLKASEILAQVWIALKLVRERGLPPLVNVVFMGMGEPLNNLGAVARGRADARAPGRLPPLRRNVHVSTVGPTRAHPPRRAAAVPPRLVGPRRRRRPRRRSPTTNHREVSCARRLPTRSGAATPSTPPPVERASFRGVNDQVEHAEALADFQRARRRTTTTSVA